MLAKKNCAQAKATPASGRVLMEKGECEGDNSVLLLPFLILTSDFITFPSYLYLHIHTEGVGLCLIVLRVGVCVFFVVIS